MSSPLDIISRTSAGNTASSNSVATGTQAHAAGNGLVVLITHGRGVADSAPTNTALDTFIQCGSVFNTGPSLNDYTIWYTSSSLGHASDVVTGHFASAIDYRSITVYELYGAITFHQTKSGVQASGTTLATSAFTLLSTTELILAYGIVAAHPVITSGTGYTLTQHAITNDANEYFFDAYHLITAGETASASWSGASAADIFGASFYAFGTGGASAVYGAPFYYGIGNEINV